MRPSLSFTNKTDWNCYFIHELCDILTGYPFEGNTIKSKGRNALMRGINITEGYIRHSKDIDRFFDGDTTSLSKYRLNLNDLVISMDGSKVGKNSALVTDKETGALLVQRVARLRSSDIDTIQLLLQLFGSNRFFKYVDNIKTSSAIPHISLVDIKQFVVALPTDEHEKNLLSSFCKLFREHTTLAQAQLHKLQQIKSACLQSMFPQEGESVPKVRFKGFNEEWRTKRLSDCLLVSHDKNADNIYTVNDVLSVSDDYGVKNQIELLGRSYAGKSVTNYGILHKGDIVFTKSPLKSKPFGIVKMNTYKTGIVSVLYAIYKANKNISPLYIHYYFDPAWRLNKYLSPLVNKGAKNTMNISDEYALSGEIMIPSFQEQQKIAAYFENLDKQISLQTQRLEKLKQIKTSCLDKMFV